MARLADPATRPRTVLMLALLLAGASLTLSAAWPVLVALAAP
jgi:hypothetical protein